MIEDVVLTKHKCPACGCEPMEVFFEIDTVPVFCNVLYDNPRQARQADTGRIHLAHCKDCQIVYNVAFDPELVEYCPAYENSLHYSPRFQQYANEIANDLVKRYKLYNKDIIEIGCGQGDFLAMLQRLGGNRAVGFDPSYCSLHKEHLQSLAIKIISQAYSRAHSGHPADFICCRHVLEHVDRPYDFLRNIYETVAEKKDAIVYFEVPNVLFTLKDGAIWDIIYEHCSYFTLGSLANLFVKVGFEPINLSEQYEGQFISIEARAASNTTATAKFSIPQADTRSLARQFKYAYDEKVLSWHRQLSVLSARKRRMVLWGAGSKGVSFLNVLDVSDEQIEYVVDVNPRKQGRFIAGTAQQIISPDQLKSCRPDVIIVMNPVYRAEIERLLDELGVKADVMIA
ncbi:MAG TPA: methyltransferase domain-containing protein [Phycisphaerales bacterium]|nr:methyltransferase domain-containing protein [Phycisphaerales bacterium]